MLSRNRPQNIASMCARQLVTESACTCAQGRTNWGTSSSCSSSAARYARRRADATRLVGSGESAGESASYSAESGWVIRSGVVSQAWPITVSRGLRESRTQEGTHRFYRFRTPLRVFFFFLLFFIETAVSVALSGGARTVSIKKNAQRRAKPIETVRALLSPAFS